MNLRAALLRTLSNLKAKSCQYECGNTCTTPQALSGLTLEVSSVCCTKHGGFSPPPWPRLGHHPGAEQQDAGLAWLSSWAAPMGRLRFHGLAHHWHIHPADYFKLLLGWPCSGPLPRAPHRQIATPQIRAPAISYTSYTIPAAGMRVRFTQGLDWQQSGP